LGAQREAAYALEGAAHLAAASGEDALALRWLGAAAALRERIGTTPLPAERDELEALRAGLEERLGGAAAGAAAEQGRALPLEAVVGAALAWMEAPLPAAPGAR